MSQLLDAKPPNADDADAATSRLAESLGDRYSTSLDAANRFSSASKNDPDRVSSLLQRVLPSRLLDERGKAERKTTKELESQEVRTPGTSLTLKPK